MKLATTPLSLVLVLCFAACSRPMLQGQSIVKSDVAECDPRGLIKSLGAGGVFGSQGVVYTQAHVIPGVIHPLMKEKEAVGSLGLYHAYEPKDSIESVVNAMNDISSLALQAQAAEPRMASPQSMVFEGLNKTLNVFSVDETKLLKISSLKIDVPPESSAVVIIRGKTPALSGTKIENPFNIEKVLFVLPEATSFSVRGDRFGGTVIAPKAQIHVDAKHEGSLYGENVRSMMVTKPLLYNGCMLASDQFKN